MAITESIQIFSGNQKSYTCVFNPANPPKAVIVFVHGLGEHIRRYDEQFLYFNTKGYAIVSADLMGHGRSEGIRGVWSSLDNHYDVIHGLFDFARAAYSELPVILYGHSMGGNLVAGYVCAFSPSLAGLIVTGAAIKTTKDLPLFVIKMVLSSPSWIKNKVIPNGLNLKSLCNDPDIVTRYLSDPLVHDSISLGAGASLLMNADYILRSTALPNYPILLMHGEKDTITLPEGTKLLNQKWPESILKIWPGMLHEIHNEPHKKEVWDYTLDWIDQVIQ